MGADTAGRGCGRKLGRYRGNRSTCGPGPREASWMTATGTHDRWKRPGGVGRYGRWRLESRRAVVRRLKTAGLGFAVLEPAVSSRGVGCGSRTSTRNSVLPCRAARGHVGYGRRSCPSRRYYSRCRRSCKSVWRSAGFPVFRTTSVGDRGTVEHAPAPGRAGGAGCRGKQLARRCTGVGRTAH